MVFIIWSNKYTRPGDAVNTAAAVRPPKRRGCVLGVEPQGAARQYRFRSVRSYRAEALAPILFRSRPLRRRLRHEKRPLKIRSREPSTEAMFLGLNADVGPEARSKL